MRSSSVWPVEELTSQVEAEPILTETKIGPPVVDTDTSAMQLRNLSPAVMAPLALQLGRIIRNSSPPYRPTESQPRIEAVSRLATSART